MIAEKRDGNRNDYYVVMPHGPGERRNVLLLILLLLPSIHNNKIISYEHGKRSHGYDRTQPVRGARLLPCTDGTRVAVTAPPSVRRHGTVIDVVAAAATIAVVAAAAAVDDDPVLTPSPHRLTTPTKGNALAAGLRVGSARTAWRSGVEFQ